MPGKHVRFAYENTFHSAPPTPALSFTSSTEPSSSGIVTPTSTTHSLRGLSPRDEPHYPDTHNDWTGFDHPLPHRYLGAYVISWDLRDHPSNITRSEQPISEATLQEPAVTPTLMDMRITSTYLPWSIKVSAANGVFITVEDVLETIYHSLRNNVTSSEFNRITSPGNQRRATRAYEVRFRSLKGTSVYEREKRSGMKRVDFLMGHTQFMGVYQSTCRPEEWYLSVE